LSLFCAWVRIEGTGSSSVYGGYGGGQATNQTQKELAVSAGVDAVIVDI